MGVEFSRFSKKDGSDFSPVNMEGLVKQVGLFLKKGGTCHFFHTN